MTTLQQAEEAILTRWFDQWVSGSSVRTPTVLEGEKKPDGVSIGETNWVQLYIQDLPSNQLTLGTAGRRRFSRKAQVVIEIHTPSNVGTKDALDLAHLARTVFEGVRLSPLCNFTSANVVRNGHQPPEYVVSVLCPFEYEETK